RRIYRKVIQARAFMCIDAETRPYRDATLQLYRQLRSDPEFRDHPHLGVALQVYFRDSEQTLEDLLAWARRQGLAISIRLVKGAYWENEVEEAQAAGVEPTVYTVKAETDVAFERTTETVLRNHDVCHLACASHNVRSVCATMAIAEQLGAPPQSYEFQALYGMASPFRRALLETVGRVRLYCPYGHLLEGMAYLVRRLLENTSNESALRLTFAGEADRDRLLDDPQTTLEKITAQSD
ncbi:MAG: proline dehydrogenase family protein, partial [Sedimentisphaerales bacterium]|nr:proline dehydrogenase family protein [Sedimentisphaerales bacterium]